MGLIPPPPELKPTIIQMQNSNSESNENTPDQFPNMQPTEGNSAAKKRRRRSSSSLVSQSEVEKRRREHKTAHSIIEKKRRIRMNREFEALKYLIPACRNSLISGTSANNNGEGMYKLTILQATVDYIKYLHQVINIQDDELAHHKTQREAEEDASVLQFSSIELDTEAYRNVDSEFDFNKLLEEYGAKASLMSNRLRPKVVEAQSEPLRARSLDNNLKFPSLPSPVITPELYPNSSTMNSSILNRSLSFNFKPGFQFGSDSTMTNESIPFNDTSSLSKVEFPKIHQTISQSRHLSISYPQMSVTSESTNDSRQSSESLSSLLPSISPNIRLGLGNPNNLTSINGQERSNGVESDSANVLMNMKRDSGPTSSIQSLLN
jgi:hypothetical protein